MLDPLGIYTVDEATAAQLSQAAVQPAASGTRESRLAHDSDVHGVDTSFLVSEPKVSEESGESGGTGGAGGVGGIGGAGGSVAAGGSADAGNELRRDASASSGSTHNLNSGPGPVLIHALRGYVDAGSVAQVASQHLLDTMDATRLVTFDMDQLLDYRSKRPLMEFDADRWSQYDDPYLVIDYVRDGEGNPFLLLHGTEPDLQWERVVAAILQVVNRFSVSLVVGFHGIPMGVPHTRPLTLTAHGTRTGLTEDYTSFFGTVKVPSSLGGLLEYRLGEADHDAMGFAIHVPHYVSQTQYPPAAVTALQHVERATGLELRTERLAVEGSEITTAIENEVRESREVGAVIKALEEAYDRFASQVGTPGRIIDADGPLPSAEELAAEFEKFLAEADGQSDEEMPTLGGY